MKDFLKKIVSAIVDDPTKVEVTQTEENGQGIYTVVLPQEEIGRVIGKEGKVIAAIRVLARLKALKNQEKIFIKVEGRP